ncbi:MAG TPA: GNAT family N-acetyltransferase [Acidimicrobiales bacterium]|nr:GNAT family N-acetyltransferase [Acidimicrobiales bacterium]
MESVRAAREDDAERVEQLAAEMVEALSEQRGAAEAGAAGWQRPRGDHAVRWLPPAALDGHRAWVGVLDDKVCGFAMAHVEPWADGARRGVLDACFVEAGARGLGLGRLLLEACLGWLAAEGCDGVDGTAFPGDRSAKNFFEAAGFKARLLTMHRKLG